MRRALTASIDALPPRLRYRVRNAIALWRWSGARVARGSGHRTAYDDAFWDHHASEEWAPFASIVLQCCQPTSIVDIGCGEGKFLRAVARITPHTRLLGIDSSPAALRRARAGGVEVVEMDLAVCRRATVARLRQLVSGFELAVCLETAEHVPPWCATSLVEVLSGAPAVLFSAAHPNQLGTLHMNEQPFEYWRRRFTRFGLHTSPDDGRLRDAVAALDLPPWYAANVHLFVKVGA